MLFFLRTPHDYVFHYPPDACAPPHMCTIHIPYLRACDIVRSRLFSRQRLGFHPCFTPCQQSEATGNDPFFFSLFSLSLSLLSLSLSFSRSSLFLFHGILFLPPSASPTSLLPTGKETTDVTAARQYPTAPSPPGGQVRQGRPSGWSPPIFRLRRRPAQLDAAVVEDQVLDSARFDEFDVFLTITASDSLFLLPAGPSGRAKIPNQGRPGRP